jgi:putative membrane protein
MHMIVLLLIIGILIASIVWLVSARMQRAHAPRLPARRSQGLEVLEGRYVRGEINRDEYLQKRHDILG